MGVSRIVLAAVAAAALIIPGSVGAQTTPAPAPAASVAGEPIASAASHIAILDYGTGQTLYCRRCNEPMSPSSMSKLMTLLVVADQIRAGKITLDTEFGVSEKAWRHGASSDGSHMFLELNSRVRVEDLLRGAAIVSANDACIALAEGVAGSEEGFVDLMNARARELGLTSAQFRNATGLPDPDHVVSASDLARLSAVIIRDYPELYRHYSERSLTYNGKTQGNRNPLLGMPGADGVKTGHTSVAGYGMIGSATLNSQRRIVVINGLPTNAARAEEAKRLINAAFYDFSVTSLFEKDAVVGAAEVWLGARDRVPLVATQNIAVAAHRAARAGMKAAVVYDGPVAAPIKKGDVIARLVVEGPGVRQEFPLAAGARVGRANPFARAGFGLSRVFGGG
ncbi:MAG: D-alanyl-D-alanine carboxypeptidase family protein [Hyphomonadaceae bacterium]|nr:D-alanyl-D-alanine carboxypeptidase family protein [Hyphomonadaceae bacterium]